MTSAVGTWVWVPSTACALPARWYPSACFSLVASAWASTSTRSAPSSSSSATARSAASKGETGVQSMKTCPSTLATPTVTPSTSKVPQPRPGRFSSRFAGRATLSSASRNSSYPSASKAWLPRVRKSATESRAAPLSLVIPLPPGAEFSALATTASSPSCSRRSGTRSRTAEHPAGPTTSPTNSNLKVKKLSPRPAGSQKLSQSRGQVFEEIGGDQALRGPAGLFEPELRRPPVRPGAGPCRLVGVHPAREEGPDHARQYIPRPGGGERDVTRRVDPDPLALDDQRVRALEEHAAPVLPGRAARGAEPAGGDLLRPGVQQTPELPGVRRDHGRGVSFCEGVHPGNVRDGVGVEEHRRVDLTQDPPDETAALFPGTHPRPDHERRSSPGELQDLVQRGGGHVAFSILRNAVDERLRELEVHCGGRALR